jgi:predicted peptidase
MRPSAGNRMTGRLGVPRVLVLGLLVALVACLLVTPVASADPAGLELRSTQQLSSWLIQLRVYSPALAHEANVRVLTPDGFDPDRDHLPVLWLLHGGFGSSADWTTVGDAEALTAHVPVGRSPASRWAGSER